MIRTATGHEQTSKERGSRFWAAAEILSTTWFIAETCVEVAGRREIRQWVTTSIHQAALIRHSMEVHCWARIFACIRAPLIIQNGTPFEVVREPYQAGARDSYVLLLDNGMSFASGIEAAEGLGKGPEELRLIYAKGRDQPGWTSRLGDWHGTHLQSII